MPGGAGEPFISAIGGLLPMALPAADADRPLHPSSATLKLGDIVAVTGNSASWIREHAN